MNKNFKFYALIWTILLAVWCAVVFLVQPVIPRYVINYDTHFWIAFVFIVLTFIGNLVCAYLAFKPEALTSVFLNLPLITVSWSALIAMLVAGSALMLIPNFPAWLTAIVCIVILACNAVAVIKAGWAAEAVQAVDEKVKTQTSFIRNLTVDTESILSHAKSESVKAECKKVYEAVRYSDPMSNAALSGIETKITSMTGEFSSAVGDDDAEKVKVIAEELIAFIGERNKKCKALK